MKKVIWAGLSIIILVSIFCIVFSPEPKLSAKPIHPFSKGKYNKSYLEFKKGIPIVHLYGTPKEMGKALGYLTAKQIRALVNGYLFHKKLFPKHSDKYKEALKKAYAMEKTIPKRYLDEMLGISETSNIPYDHILLANTFLEMREYMFCSTFVVKKANSEENTLMVGRNLDFYPLGVLNKYDIIVVYHSDNANKVISITWPGLIGAVSAMNEYGLTANMLVSATGKKNYKPYIPSTIAFRELLEKEKTVNGSVKYFNKIINIASANNLTVADTNNNALVFELSPIRKPNIRRFTGHSLLATNYFIEEEGKLSSSDKGYRYNIMSMVSNYHNTFGIRISLSTIKTTLGLVALADQNIQAMVFLPEKRKVYLSVDVMPASAGIYKELDLGNLFKQKVKNAL